MLHRGFFACLAALAALLSAGCSAPADYTVVEGTMLGTTMRVVADVKDATPQELYAAAMELDREAKASMSIFDPTSLLSRLNRNETDSVDRHIAFNLRLADSIGALSDGRYDVTVKPLVEAWGFAGREAQAHPNVDSILAFVGRDKVRIEQGRLVKSDPRVELDFNSVAKGYTVDLLAALVERFGAENYIVDIGGEVRCRGVNRSGDPWRIGVETPFDGTGRMACWRVESRPQTISRLISSPTEKKKTTIRPSLINFSTVIPRGKIQSITPSGEWTIAESSVSSRWW